MGAEKKNPLSFVLEIASFLSAHRKSIFVNSVWLGLGECVAKVCMFLVTVQVIRYLRPDDYGRLCLATALANMAALLLDFGMTQVVIRDLARERSASSRYLSQVVSLKIVLGLVYLVLLVVLAKPVIGEGVVWLLLLIGYMNWVQDLSGACISWFMAEERMEKILFVQAVHYGGMLLAATMAARGGLGIEALLGSYVAAALAGMATAVFLIQREGLSVRVAFDPGLIRYLFHQSYPLFGVLLVGAVYANADTLLIGRMRSVTDVAFYQAAYKILFVIQGMTLLHTAVFPRLSVFVKTRQDRQTELLHWCVFLFTAFGMAPAAVAATIYAPEILTYVYGGKMLPSVRALQFLIWVGVVFFVKIYLMNFFIAHGRQRPLFYLSLLSLAANLGLNAYLLRHHAFAAAAAVLLFSESLMVAAMLFLRYASRGERWAMGIRGHAHPQGHRGC